MPVSSRSRSAASAKAENADAVVVSKKAVLESSAPALSEVTNAPAEAPKRAGRTSKPKPADVPVNPAPVSAPVEAATKKGGRKTAKSTKEDTVAPADNMDVAQKIEEVTSESEKSKTHRTRTTFDDEGNPVAVAVEAVSTPALEHHVDDLEPAAEEEEEEEVAAGDDESAATDPASSTSYREVPSHFYPEAKSRSTDWCGTHTRFDDETSADAAPVSEETIAAIDRLGESMSTAMTLDSEPAAAAPAADGKKKSRAAKPKK